MNAPIYISNRVIDTINSLPKDDRIAVANAITTQLILGSELTDELTPIQHLAFTIICQYLRNDTRKMLPEC